MNSSLKPTGRSLSSKLLLMNLMTVAAFIVLACAVIYSLYSIEEKAVKVTNRNIDSVINNSRVTRKLSTLFSDIDLLNRTFSMDHNHLESEGDRLAVIIKDLTNSTADIELKNYLEILSDNFASFIARSNTVNTVLHARSSLDQEANLELIELENLIGGLLIDATLAGKETSFITQQLTLVIGYRESFLSIAKLYAEQGIEINSGTFSGTASPIISAIDDLALRIQTINASFPEVALHGKYIEQIVRKYKQNVLDYHMAMDGLNKHRTILEQSKISLLAEMERIDTEISNTAKNTTSSIDDIIFSYGLFVFILTIVMIIALFITTKNLIKFNIQNPMQAVLSGIDSFSKGDFNKQIKLSRNDEWSIINNALNNMAIALRASYRTIEKSRDELENRVEERTRELSYTVEALSKSKSDLMEEKERAQVTLHSIGDAVISTDAEGNVEYLNPVAEMLTGYTLDESRGKPLEHIFQIINEETRERALNPAARCMKEGKIVGLANHTVLVSKSGKEFAIQDSAAPIKNPEGAILGVVLVFSDVTEARSLSRQVSYQASHDMLTGLINRREFENRLKRVLETARSSSTNNALCYLDLDQFKLVNDTCGHIAGDELLRQVSKLLQENVRHRDTVARLGGDEFGLLMEHCSLKEALQVANKLVKSVSEYKFSWEKRSFNVGVSIGLIVINASSSNINELLSAADTACYMAKDQGRSRVHIYREDDEELAKRHGEMQWAAMLPRALEENNFLLYLQPIAPVASKLDENIHYEILLRMKGKDNIMPNAFLPAADRYNLSSKLDRWVISTTFKWIFNHPAHLQRLNLCAINLSGHSLNDETFVDFIHRKFEEFPVPAEKVCFEITETVAIANFSRTAAFMEVLKDRGCRFSLDDFGSGLSSYAYLKNLPVDFLKIDGVFVKDILKDPLDLALVKSINEIGHVMGMQTIAEFVENEALLEKLREIGVDYAQGYWIAHPRPIEDEEIFKS